MATQLPATLVFVSLLAPLDLTTIEQYLNVTYTLNSVSKGYISRIPGSLSPIPNVVQPSAVGQLLKVLILDVATAFTLPDGVVAVTPDLPVDPVITITKFEASAS